MRGAPILLVSILLLTLVPVTFAAYIGPVPPGGAPVITSTTSRGLNSTTKTQKATYNPSAVDGLRQDLGKFSMVTSLTAIQWNVTNNDYLQFNPPSVGPTALSNSVIYYNSTETVWQMASGLNTVSVFVKPTGYSANIFIQANLASAQQVCFPLNSVSKIIQPVGVISQNQTGLLPMVSVGNEVFSWSDIPVGYLPSWNSTSNRLCASLPTGLTKIDPLALDGSGHTYCAACGTAAISTTLTTASSPDVIIAFFACNGATDCFSSLSGGGLSWSRRTYQSSASSPDRQMYEYCAIASGTLSAQTITFTATSSGKYTDLTVFGISGANTSGCASSTYDPNGSLPAFHKDVSGASDPTVNVSTSNAADIIIGFASVTNAGHFVSAGSGYTEISHSDYWATQYQVVAVTETNFACGVNFGGNGAGNVMLCDAVQGASASVTQPIQVLLGEVGPSYPTIGITGCGVSNSTFTTANVHTYTLSAFCSVTLSNPAATTYTRYKFNVSPHPQASTSISFTTCASGTCSLYQNTTYYQVQNNFTEIAQSPTKWDGRYDNQPLPNLKPPGFNDFTGTYLGFMITATSSTDICYVNGNIQGYAETFEGLTYGRCESSESGLVGYMWSDYGTGCWPVRIGNSWNLQTSCPTPTTGNNLYIGNYKQSSGTSGSSFADAPWVAIPIVLIFFTMGGIILYLPKRSRLRE